MQQQRNVMYTKHLGYLRMISPFDDEWKMANKMIWLVFEHCTKRLMFLIIFAFGEWYLCFDVMFSLENCYSDLLPPVYVSS